MARSMDSQNPMTPERPASPGIVIIGAGFTGSVVAERLASAGQQVLVIPAPAHRRQRLIMLRDGYTALFQRMLDHPNIHLELGADFFAIRHRLKAKTMVYTGPIDAYFDYCHGPLPYRSLRFEHQHLPGIAQYQPVAGWLTPVSARLAPDLDFNVRAAAPSEK